MDAKEKYVVMSLDENNADADILNPKEETVVCEVCGCENKKNALMCKLCSNYFSNEAEIRASLLQSKKSAGK